VCGIAAIIGMPSGSAAEMERMNASLAHRGPDAQGTWLDSRCSLGSTRLAVIDIDGGIQPMFSADGRLAIVFNGEIYNFLSLRGQLLRDGATLRTRSDTEVILEGFRLYGEQLVPQLNGQFAFLIWDIESGSGFAARDRLGEKPLYWANPSQGELVVASEIRGILASGRVIPRLDAAAVDAYLALNYVPPSLCIYENVFTLPPGHTLTWESGKVHIERYWRPRLSTDDVSFDEAVRHVRVLFEAAVDRQMTAADVEVGCFLSGGRDSTSVVALMAQSSAQIKTFSVGFGDLINELPYAREVARAFNTDHRELEVDVNLGSVLEEVVAAFDEPFGDSSNVPMYLLSQFARQDVKVVLSGDGGDELFGGYEWYRPAVVAQELRERGAAAAGLRAKALSLRAFAKANLVSEDRLARALHQRAGVDLARTHADAFNGHLAFIANRPYPAGSDRSIGMIQSLYRPGDDVRGVDRAVSFDLESYLPGDILVKVDRAAMANSLEVRSPFLDAELVDFVLSTPAALRFDAASSKPLLRAALSDLWPKAIASRPKQGFGAPVGEWLSRPDVSSLEKRVWAPDSPLRHVVGGHGPRPDGPQDRWTLLNLGLWLERNVACLSLA